MSREWRSSRNSVEQGLCTLDCAEPSSPSQDWHVLAKQICRWEAIGWAVSEQCSFSLEGTHTVY